MDNMGKVRKKKKREGRWGKGKKDDCEKGRRKKGKKGRSTMGKGKRGKRDMSHSLKRVGGYVGLIQGIVKYSRPLIRPLLE